MGNNTDDTVANNSLEKSNISTLSQEQATDSNAIQIPSISLPKGGGALKGIDEKFQVNSANGTAGYSIPVPVSPGRNGFSPSLALSYNSGSGNSPYGLGWSVGYPMIQRKTDKKLPRYRDKDGFMFSGAEDLVPYLEDDNGEWIDKVYPKDADGIIVKRYRPRIEGDFTRIEKIQHPILGTYWKVTTGDNIATIFGRSKQARIADPNDSSRIFQWMPEFSYDDKGNWIQYHYKKEDLSNVAISVYEKNRINKRAPFTNTYLKRITYGNKKAYYAKKDSPYNPKLPEVTDTYFFEVVMDYGEHSDKRNPYDAINDWDYRPDAFSSYRSGFEIRTNRLCKRILMFHHFKDEQQLHGYADNGDRITSPFGENYLVRSLDLDYEASSINDSTQTEVTYLKSINQSGYIRKPNGDYSIKSLPPMDFTYQKLNWNKTIKTVNKQAIVNAPVGLSNNYQWVDLYGEGISGILTEQAGGLFYKSNLGNVANKSEVAFTRAQEVLNKPSFAGLSLQDLAANGEKQFVVNAPGVNGYFELAEDKSWKPFKSFEQIANINLQDPNTRLIDLNGDGQPELVVTIRRQLT